jgi:hypothetical protein
MGFEQQARIKYLRFKGIKLIKIFPELKKMYGQDAYNAPDVKYTDSKKYIVM